ncbi:MAG: hypothetical protein RRY69_07790 [Oscillospiraceae bacterium]
MPIYTAPNDIPTVSVSKLKISRFGGVDETNQPSGVDTARACFAPNMIRDVPGKVRKRVGYEKVASYGARINGAFEIRGRTIIHAGAKLYDGTAEIFSGLADMKSSGVKFDGKILLLDGVKMRVYGEFDNPSYDSAIAGSSPKIWSVKSVEELAKIPTVTIARAPNGGGTTFEAVNMLQSKRKDSFLGTTNDTTYQLSFDNLDADACMAWILDGKGDWVQKSENTDFSVERVTGKVTFLTAPGASPVTGEDNVIIQSCKTNADYKNRVNKCMFGICYGVKSAADRVFISGNPDYKNYDFFCGLNDLTYWGDLWYGVIGQSHSPIVGYTIINSYLATHKQNDDNSRNIVLRYGTLDTIGNPQFLIPDKDGIIQGAGAVAAHSFGFAQEPMFLTETGICATTPYTYNAERYVQNRSFYLNNTLKKETNLSEAYACIYKDFYMLAVNSQIYILDTLSRIESGQAQSEFQHEAYHWIDISSRILYTSGGRLYLGTDSGEIMRFYDDATLSSSYSDNGRAISAQWDFDFSGANVYLKKSLKYFSIIMAPGAQASCDVWIRKSDAWQRVLSTDGMSADYLDFDNIDFDNFTFNTDQFPLTVGKKTKIKKFDTIRVSLRNSTVNQSFGFYEIALEYVEGSYYKGGARE